MNRKAPVLLTLDEIRSKDPELFTDEGFTNALIGSLYDAQILLGIYDRTKRQVKIFEHTWEVMKSHISYTLYAHAKTYDKNTTFNIPIPVYIDNPRKITNFSINSYYKPSELLKHYDWLKESKIFNESFLGQLVHKHIVRGKYDFAESCMLISKFSFDDLLRLRNYNIDQNLKFDPSDE